MVLDINKDKEITVVSRSEGLELIKAKAIILAMGCRERPRGALNIPGYRPAGIYTAGTAQRLMNIEGHMVGKRGCHPRFRRYRTDHGETYDTGGRKG